MDLALTLLKARVFLVDDVELAIAADQLAVYATLLDGGFDFHCSKNLFLASRFLSLCLLIKNLIVL